MKLSGNTQVTTQTIAKARNPSPVFTHGWAASLALVGGGGDEPAVDQNHVDGADPRTPWAARGRLLGQRCVSHREQGRAGGVDRRVHAAERQHLGSGLERQRVAVIERGGAQQHPRLLPEVEQVAGDQRDQERRPGDRPVDRRDLRAIGAQLLGNDRARNTLTLLADALCPLQRWLAEALRAVQRDPLGDMLGVAIGNLRKPPPF